MALSPERLKAERQRAMDARAQNTYTDMVEQARGTYRRPKPKSEGRYQARTAPDVASLILPEPSPEALHCPARAKAESEGFANFGKRTWFLVERDGRYRAVETMDDAPGWSLVKEMKR